MYDLGDLVNPRCPGETSEICDEYFRVAVVLAVRRDTAGVLCATCFIRVVSGSCLVGCGGQ